MAIHIDELPKWAKKAIKEAGIDGMVQINKFGENLTVHNGVARYNNQLVYSGDEPEDNEDDTSILFEELPKWAKEAINKSGLFDVTQKIYNGNSLQIARGEAKFNGKSVVRN